jgi:hypothetical protein
MATGRRWSEEEIVTKADHAVQSNGDFERRWYESMLSTTLGAVLVGLLFLLTAGVGPALVGAAAGGAAGAAIYHKGVPRPAG